MGRAHEVRAASMAKTAAMKSKLYAKYSKEILIAAKAGAPDPNSNLALRRAIDKAKANQVPGDVIKRAIEKASSSNAESYIANVYEGFGPGASTLIIESLTDNPNRAIAEIRGCFNKCHSKIGVSGSVSFNYTHCSVVSIKGATQEEVEEALILNDANFSSLEVDEDIITVYGEISDLYNIKDALDATFGEKITYVICENEYIANEYVTLNDEDKPVFDRLIATLEELDDVENVYHNVD
jgi:YebC/PmpR family DNA-binding regulatory protein